MTDEPNLNNNGHKKKNASVMIISERSHKLLHGRKKEIRPLFRNNIPGMLHHHLVFYASVDLLATPFRCSIMSLCYHLKFIILIPSRAMLKSIFCITISFSYLRFMRLTQELSYPWFKEEKEASHPTGFYKSS